MAINQEDQTLDGRGRFVPVCSLKFFSLEEEPEKWRKIKIKHTSVFKRPGPVSEQALAFRFCLGHIFPSLTEAALSVSEPHIPC